MAITTVSSLAELYTSGVAPSAEEDSSKMAKMVEQGDSRVEDVVDAAKGQPISAGEPPLGEEVTSSEVKPKRDDDIGVGEKNEEPDESDASDEDIVLQVHD